MHNGEMIRSYITHLTFAIYRCNTSIPFSQWFLTLFTHVSFLGSYHLYNVYLVNLNTLLTYTLEKLTRTWVWELVLWTIRREAHVMLHDFVKGRLSVRWEAQTKGVSF